MCGNTEKRRRIVFDFFALCGKIISEEKAVSPPINARRKQMADYTTHYITAYKFLEGKGFSKNFSEGFYFGVQGPDIFFYHTPLKGGSDGYVIGGKLHKKTQEEIFSKGVEKIFERNDYYRGYYFGVLLHYYGDANIHPYVGFLERECKNALSHAEIEKRIDVEMYKYTFKKPVSEFDVSSAYKVSSPLCEEIVNFWTERTDILNVSERYIRKCMNNMVNFNRIFTNCNKTLLKILKKFDGDGQSLTGHFKYGEYETVLNLEKRPWTRPDGEVNLSVPEMAENAVSEFEKKYEEIKNGDVTFTDVRTFEYGL